MKRDILSFPIYTATYERCNWGMNGPSWMVTVSKHGEPVLSQVLNFEADLEPVIALLKASGLAVREIKSGESEVPRHLQKWERWEG